MISECPDCGKPNPRGWCRWCGWSAKDSPTGEPSFRFVPCSGMLPVLDGSQLTPCNTVLREVAQGPIRPFTCRACRERQKKSEGGIDTL